MGSFGFFSASSIIRGGDPAPPAPTLPSPSAVLPLPQTMRRLAEFLHQRLVLLRGRGRLVPAFIPSRRHGQAEQNDQDPTHHAVHVSVLLLSSYSQGEGQGIRSRSNSGYCRPIGRF